MQNRTNLNKFLTKQSKVSNNYLFKTKRSKRSFRNNESKTLLFEKPPKIKLRIKAKLYRFVARIELWLKIKNSLKKIQRRQSFKFYPTSILSMLWRSKRHLTFVPAIGSKKTTTFEFSSSASTSTSSNRTNTFRMNGRNAGCNFGMAERFASILFRKFFQLLSFEQLAICEPETL